MTKQETHTCDRCHETFNTPDYSIGCIEKYTVNGDVILENHEFCYKCRESFEKWLNDFKALGLFID